MREYFRKPNIATSYNDMFERRSEQLLEYESVYRHSELKKPYESTSYDDMEQLENYSFNYPYDLPSYDTPGGTSSPWSTSQPVVKGGQTITVHRDGTTTVKYIGAKTIVRTTGGVTITYYTAPETTYWSETKTTTKTSGGGAIETSIPSIGGPNAPPSDCYALWKKSFGDWEGGFLSSSQAAAFNKYAQSCPIYVYPPYSCCTGARLDRSFESSAPSGCFYTWRKTKVSESGGVCVWLIEVYTMWEERACASQLISTPCAKSPTYIEDTFYYTPVTCGSASIGYVSQQMAVNDIQSFTVGSPASGTTYTWAIAAGGTGSITSDGVYTAPASNAECAGNPTIQLKAGEIVCATLPIAVNAVATHTYYAWQHCVFDYCQHGGLGDGWEIAWGNQTYAYCDGITVGPTAVQDGIHANPGGCSASTAEMLASSACVPEDKRTAAQKTAGCCSSQLL